MATILRSIAHALAGFAPSSQRLTLRVALLVSAVLVSLGAVASLFWALHEVLYQIVGPGWGAVLTSLALWGVAALLWFAAWLVPLRRRRRPRRREPFITLHETAMPPRMPFASGAVWIVAATALLRTMRERREARRPPS